MCWLSDMRVLFDRYFISACLDWTLSVAAQKSDGYISACHFPAEMEILQKRRLKMSNMDSVVEQAPIFPLNAHPKLVY